MILSVQARNKNKPGQMQAKNVVGGWCHLTWHEIYRFCAPRATRGMWWRPFQRSLEGRLRGMGMGMMPGMPGMPGMDYGMAGMDAYGGMAGMAYPTPGDLNSLPALRQQVPCCPVEYVTRGWSRPGTA